ncbi:hypothetical protein [Solimonas marina]|uniref:Uncharacterized protein n=1 Tax=Solimonas marina TaxID=2714601 RepID=A0A970BAH1_9GAMM|nr:hypothetical protein [Solimonas marina]NKF24414.1 hypothetical protein [Solimonas marina]
MDLPLPSTFHRELSAERLNLIASWLLEEYYATQEDLVRDTDSSYTRGCTAFGRQRGRIMKEAASLKYSWLSIKGAGNDLVFGIGHVPCRYSNDDPDNPKKDAVLVANQHQLPFLDFEDDLAPTRFCFVLDKGLEGVTDAHVELLGYTGAGTLVSRWISSNVRTLHAVNDQKLSSAVPVGKPVLAPKRRDAANGDDNVVAPQS